MMWAESALSALLVVLLTWGITVLRMIRRQHEWLITSVEKVLAVLHIDNGKAPGR